MPARRSGCASSRCGGSANPATSPTRSFTSQVRNQATSPGRRSTSTAAERSECRSADPREACNPSPPTPGARPVKKKIYTPNAPTPGAPYAQAIEANGFIFVTGQVSRDAKSGEFVDGPFGDQLHRCIKNLETILVAANASLDNVVKLT